MAKTIKFNLICDDRPIRTLEDLRENFSIEDVMKYYETGLLLKWVTTRGFDKQKEKIEALKNDDKLEIAKELVKIFEIETDDKKIEQDIYMLRFRDDERKLLDEYEKKKYRKDKIVEDYHDGFWRLIDEIKENPNDVAIVKANIAEIMKNYDELMYNNHRKIFYDCIDYWPLAILCLLMHAEARKYYLPIPYEDDDSVDEADTQKPQNVGLDTEWDKDKREMYQMLCRKINENDFPTDVGDSLIIKQCDADLPTNITNKDCMIIKMSSGSGFGVKSCDEREWLKADKVNDKFLITHGIDYVNTTSARQTLIYMEV